MYAIIRCAKQKGAGLARAEGHNLRLYDEPRSNIDKSRTHLNRRIVDSGKPLTQTVNDHIAAGGVKRKIRPDAVKAVEYLFTASPEFFNESDRAGSSKKLDDWVNANMAFAEKRFGKENIVSAILHMDESTPHIHIMAVPLLKNKDGEAILSAKEWTASGALRRLQTDYAVAMHPFGLKRGEIGSTVEHTSTADDKKKTLALASQAVASADEAVKKIDTTIDRIDRQIGIHNVNLAKQTRMIEDSIRAQNAHIADLVKSQQQTIEDQRRVIEEQKTLTVKIMKMYQQAQQIIDDLKRRLGLGGGGVESAKPAADALGVDASDFASGEPSYRDAFGSMGSKPHSGGSQSHTIK